MRIYAIQYNDHISQEGYISFEQASQFIKGRVAGRSAIFSENGWKAKYEDLDGKHHEYKIYELNIK